ncbi:hypothetical protein FJY94_07130 [Candidatus Kaiserbacteria bacterium]|nr:hypothetical protein [Candidatus Kaiserbacteria bacterium]
MCTAAEIEGLLTELDHCSADDLEDQDLDFKQWDAHSRDKAVKLVVRMSAASSRNRDGPCRPALSAYRATNAGAPGQHGAGRHYRAWRQRARRLLDAAARATPTAGRAGPPRSRPPHRLGGCQGPGAQHPHGTCPAGRESAQ